MNFLQKKVSPNTIQLIDIGSVYANPYQPRTYFDAQSLAELAQSIKLHGILQPLVVRGNKNRYELIAGERRLRAAKLAGLLKIPCIIVEATDEQSSLFALIENLQRKDLDFFETALGYRRLIDSYGLTQSETAAKVGKSQSSVANKLRLLKFSPKEMEFIRKAELTERHARAVLRLESEESRFEALSHIAMYCLNVHDTDEYVEKLVNPVSEPPQTQAEIVPLKRVKASRFMPIVRDVRIFVNSVNRAVDVMRSTGIDASYDKSEEEDTIVLTVRIPKKTIAIAK